ncbi:peptidoglycan DD-metalloendopeptidase family protein [Mariprofundus ferrooxydans]|nr:peptidoglycan DD-metalloendopeptidase family protein [Mariprofundus ferrooxydans]
MLVQDFANRTHSPAMQSHARRKHRPSSLQRAWHAVQQALGRLFVIKALYIPVFAGILLLLAITTMSSLSVDASVQLTREEWLQPEGNTLLSHANSQQKVIVKAGDSAISSLNALGFNFSEIMSMQAASKKIHPLKRIQAGHAFVRHDIGDVSHVYYDVDAGQKLHLSRTGKNWHAALEKMTVTHRQVYVEATISDSLFVAASKAGLDDRTTMNLVDVFAWDIDFARDLRKGDSFQVLYEEQYNDAGKMIGTTILDATFINQGRSYHAIRYRLKSGKEDYYSLNGKSLRKAYLKAPVKYSRISSRFRSARKHPILGYTRAHKGVDYAARTGTPVHALGDGRIVFSSWKGGYGRLVEIRHTNRNHHTRYGHLSKFGRGIHKGVYVKQGQIIGYVGMSGLATGPHLHFEFRVRGRAINPLHVKHTPAKPVPKAEIASFKHHADNLQNSLKLAARQSEWG